MQAPEAKAETQFARMLFCNRCENLLYPECNPEKQMQWRCRACGNQESHDDELLVYTVALRRELGGSKALAQLAQFANDPTAHRSTERPCERCGANNIAYFVNPLEQPTEDMSLFFACVSCQHVWKQNQ